MPRVTPLITNFNAGEWSPLLHGRSDLGKYPNASRLMRNFVPLPQGAATRRPGTRLIAETKNSGEARLIRFQFSTVQTYQVEAGHTYFRFFANRGQVISAGLPVEIATPYTLADLPQLKWIQSADTLYLWHPSYKPRKLLRASHTSWSLALIDFIDGPYLNPNATPVTLTPSATTGNITIATSSASAINGGLGFQASLDVGRLVRIFNGSPGKWGYAEITAVTDPTHVNATVRRALGATTATTEWALGVWSDGLGWPACGTFHEERLWHGSTASFPQSAWSSVTGDFENMAPTDLEGDVLADSGITTTAADNEVNVIHWLASTEVLRVGSAGGEKIIRPSGTTEGLTPDTTTVKPQTTRQVADLMPVVIDRAVLFVQRQRQQLYEQLYNFDTDGYIANDLALLASHLTQRRIKEIAYQPTPWSVLWCVRDDGMLVGFTYMREQDVLGWHRHPIGGRWAGSRLNAKVLSASVISGATQDELWLVVERMVDGSTVRYIELLEDMFWPDDEDERQRAIDQESAFFLDSGLSYDGWNSDLAKTLTLSGGVTWQSGELVTMTAAGHTPFTGADIGRAYRFRDLVADVYPAVAVQITAVNSSSNVTVELMGTIPPVLRGAAVAYWARCATDYTGLAHLEGQTVQILADGAPHPDRVVAGGEISLARQAARVHAGLACPARLEGLDLEAGSAEGSARGKAKRIVRATVTFFATLGGLIGHDDAHLEDIPFRDPSMPMDLPPPLFTGDKLVSWPKGWERTARLVVVQDQPLPITVCSVAPQMAVNDG